MNPLKWALFHVRALDEWETPRLYGPVKVSVNQVGANLDLNWQAGTLLQSADPAGPYAAVTGASAPFYRTTATGTSTFYRVRLTP
jgi:hypothetical protein